MNRQLQSLLSSKIINKLSDIYNLFVPFNHRAIVFEFGGDAMINLKFFNGCANIVSRNKYYVTNYFQSFCDSLENLILPDRLSKKLTCLPINSHNQRSIVFRDSTIRMIIIPKLLYFCPIPYALYLYAAM